MLGLGPGDWLAVSFADPRAGACGQIRVEAGLDGEATALVALFARDRVVALDALNLPPDFAAADRLSVGPLEVATQDSSATIGYRRQDCALSLSCAPAGAPVDVGADGFDQPCRVFGALVVEGETSELDGLGQVGRGRGGEAARGGGVERDLAAWVSGGGLVALRAVRAPGAGEHDAESVAAVVADPDSGETVSIAEARLSTTYDTEGRQTRAGLELWPAPESDYPRRLAGEVLCVATIGGADAGGASGRWDIAFLEWHMEGRQGIGPYSLIRR